MNVQLKSYYKSEFKFALNNPFNMRLVKMFKSLSLCARVQW